jgi:cleavage and polyadenylation specificity factor subunit 1
MCDLKFTLDVAKPVLITPERLLVSLKGGELHLFHLIIDNRTISSIKVTKAGGSVLCSCVMHCVTVNDLIVIYR